MQAWYIVISFFAVAAAALGGGLLGWLGAIAIGVVARWERRILALARIRDHQPPSHAALPR